MMVEYDWKIERLEAKPLHEGHENVVSTVHWRLNGIDGEHRASVYGTVSLKYDEGGEFTPFEQLTKEQVVEWVKSSIGDEQVSKYEQNVETQIAALISPPVVSPPLPWA